MPKNVALILSWPYFGFLRHYLPDCNYLISTKDLTLLLDRKISLNSQGQKTADYIIGTNDYPGIVHEYLNRGHRAEVIEEMFFLKHGEEYYKKFDLFDMQFSARLPVALVTTLESEGKQVIGWSAPELGSKAEQAALLANHPKTSAFLPRQMIISDMGQLVSLQEELISSEIKADYLIAKSLYASRSRMPDGSDYRIFHKSNWRRFVELALAHPQWFSGNNGLLVSELIETQDPFLKNNNAVLHKVHIPTGLPAGLFQKWPLQCRKMSARIEIDRIGAHIYNLGDIFKFESWEHGHLEEYRADLLALTDVLPRRPCLYSVDIMIRPNGQMCFLEFNKLAGTFLEKIYGDQCPLGLYMKNLAQMGLI